MIPLWQAFLLFCIGAVAGWLIHVEYMALKKEEKKTDQDYLNEQTAIYDNWRKEQQKKIAQTELQKIYAKETAKKLMEGL